MKTARTIPTYVLLIGGAILFILPLYICVALSLKTEGELLATSAWSWPQNPTFDNFREVLTNPNVSFASFFKNSLTIAAFVTLGTILSCAMAAYAFSRLQFPGRERAFALLLSTMMLPGVVTMIPSYVLYKYLGWINTFLPLTVPAFFAVGAFNIFLMRQFFLGIPRELDEAALLDGASHGTIFGRVILPLSGPVLATVGIFTFIGTWRDFMGPLLYLNDVDKQTLELGLQSYNALTSSKWHLIMAGSVLVLIPLLIIFLIGQKAFIKGVAMTGMK